jgi:hypothetical protein
MALPDRFRKKPIEVQAIQWPGTITHAIQIINWVLDSGGSAYLTCLEPDSCWGPEEHGDAPHAIVIRTLEGEMQATPFDWIIKGIQGEFYPCKPDIFDATYEWAGVL